MKIKKKILVMAYAVSPYRGSEYSVAWNYVTQMSKDNDLTVIYGMSDNHMGETYTLEDYLKTHEMSNVCFISIKPNKTANSLNWLNRHNMFVYTFYYAFAIWQKQAYRYAKELVTQKHFDLVHYVGPIGYREPGYLWKLGLPYMWGPVGGANNTPRQLLHHMPLSGKLKHGFRTIANNLQFHTSRRLRKALKATDVLLTATSENQRMFCKIHNKDSICLPENAIVGEIKLNRAKFENLEKFHFIVIGRLDAGKSVHIFLEALAGVKQRNKIHVDIVGGGPLKEILQTYVIEQGLNDVITWHGQLPREEAVKIFNSAHLHVMTSVSEGNPTTIWEAMSYGVPTLSFDHCGMHDTICPRCGIRVPIASRYDDCVKAVADSIDELLKTPERLLSLAEGTIECAHRFTWDAHRQVLFECYDKAIENHKNRN